jgi:hypothetical protein
MVDVEIPLGHHFFQIPEAEPEPQGTNGRTEE